MVERGIQGLNAADELEELDLLEELNELDELEPMEDTTQSKVVLRPSAPAPSGTARSAPPPMRSSAPPPMRSSAPPPLPPEARRTRSVPGSLPSPRSGIFAIDTETAAKLDGAAGVDNDLRSRALQVDRLRLNVRLRDDRIRELERSLQTQSQREHDLERKLAELGERADALQAELTALRDGSVERDLRAQRERADELERQLNGARSERTRADELQAQLHTRYEELHAQRTRGDELQHKLDELQRQLDERGAAVAPAAGDDLKRITGIGPAFERALAKLGVTSFAQIAAWSSHDVLAFAGELNISPRRIERDEWVQKARSLAGMTDAQANVTQPGLGPTADDS
jgi:predicted flap endonuclease-1-like 5' DNA nuclease